MRVILSIFISWAAINTAQASLILSGSEVIAGAGFGNAPRILTVQGKGNASIESACNSWNGTQMVVGPAGCSNAANAGGDEPNPFTDPKYSTPTLSSLGFTEASQIGIIFDAAEPGNDGTSLMMFSLILKFYTSGGVLLHSESLANTPLTFDQTVTGNGKTNFLFVLDQPGIDAVTNAVFSTPGSGNIRIGLETTMSAVHGGPESFLAQGSTSSTIVTPQAVVPEPASMLLIGGGLIGLAMLRRRKVA